MSSKSVPNRHTYTDAIVISSAPAELNKIGPWDLCLFGNNSGKCCVSGFTLTIKGHMVSSQRGTVNTKM